jgi:hypothetical protein
MSLSGTASRASPHAASRNDQIDLKQKWHVGVDKVNDSGNWEALMTARNRGLARS